MNVVTTLPSATELVCALGVEPVGVSHECDHPPVARDRPTVVRSRVDADASAEAIDEAVHEAMAAGGVYEVDVETLDSLAPELVIAQGICEVCAVDEVVVADAVATIDADPTVLTMDPHTVDDVLGDLERLGRAMDRTERATAVRADLEARIESVRSRAAGVAERPRVAVFDWTDPVMVAAHWVPELVEAAGGAYGLANPGDRSRPREWAEIRAYDPEVLIVAPCGFELERAGQCVADLTGLPGWSALSAVREDRVWAMDGHHYVNRPGPRLVDTLEFLAGVIQPDRFEEPPSTVATRIDGR